MTLEARTGLSPVTTARLKQTRRPLLPILGAVLAGSCLAQLALPWLPLSLVLLALTGVAIARAARLAAPLLFLLLFFSPSFSTHYKKK